MRYKSLFSLVTAVLLAFFACEAMATVTINQYGNQVFKDTVILKNLPKTTQNVGTAGDGVVATEYGDGIIHETLLTLNYSTVTLKDTATPAQGGGSKIYDFPAGRILILGTTGSLQFTTTSVLASTLNASKTIDWSLGTIEYANTAGNGTLTSTEVNILPSVAATSSATINVANTATAGALASSAQFDGTSTAIDCWLNMGVPTASDIDGDATVHAAGWVKITWVWLGDY